MRRKFAGPIRGAPVPAVVKCDTVRFDGGGVMFYHRNSGETAFDLAVRQQKLEGVKGELWNPLPGLIYGGRLSGDGMVVYDQVSGKYASTPFRAWRLKSVRHPKSTIFRWYFIHRKEGLKKIGKPVWYRWSKK